LTRKPSNATKRDDQLQATIASAPHVQIEKIGHIWIYSRNTLIVEHPKRHLNRKVVIKKESTSKDFAQLVTPSSCSDVTGHLLKCWNETDSCMNNSSTRRFSYTTVRASGPPYLFTSYSSVYQTHLLSSQGQKMPVIVVQVNSYSSAKIIFRRKIIWDPIANIIFPDFLQGQPTHSTMTYKCSLQFNYDQFFYQGIIRWFVGSTF
jgi:hypothetical protein